MSNMRKVAVKVAIPSWMTWFYGMVSLGLAPWIVYLLITLPERRASIPWRATWVVFDLALIIVSVTVTYFLHKRSLWAGLVLAALAALFAADAWFDYMTSSLAADKTLAVVMDLCIELPLAVFSLWCAFYLFRQLTSLNMDKTSS